MSSKERAITTRIHPQVHFMIKSVTMFSGITAGGPTNMKDIINDAAFVATYEKLRQLGFLDATATAYKQQTGEDFIHDIDELFVAPKGEKPDEKPEEDAGILADIEAKPSD